MPLEPAVRPISRTGRVRYRWGQTHQVSVLAAESVRIVRSDLVYLVGHHVYPASELALRLADGGIGCELQEHFARNFLGVAMEGSPIGEAAPVAVATAGAFDFDCLPTVGRIGAMVAPELSPDETILRDQRVQVVAGHALGIGRVERLSLDVQTFLIVRIFSRVLSPPLEFRPRCFNA